MMVKWCSALAITAVTALTACTAPGTPELDAADGFWTGDVPQGHLQMHVLEINRDLEGFGIVQATAGEIAITLVGNRNDGLVNMTITRSQGSTAFATFSGELDGDSLVGTWNTPPGNTPSTVRFGR